MEDCADIENESEEDVPDRQHQIYLTIKEIHKLVVKKDTMNIFANPVTDDIAPGYSQIISNPIDLGSIHQNIDKKTYYKTICEYLDDLILMFKNCMTYNTPDTIFYQKAYRMHSFILKQLTLNKINKLRHTIGYASNLSIEEYGDYKSTGSQPNSKRSISPSSSECSEDVKSKKKIKLGYAFAESTPSKIFDVTIESDSSLIVDDSKPKVIEKKINPSLSFIKTSHVKLDKSFGSPKIISNSLIKTDVEVKEDPESDSEIVDLVAIKQKNDIILDKLGKNRPEFGFLESYSESIYVNYLDDTKEKVKVSYSPFISSCLRDKNFKKAFENLDVVPEDFSEKIESLKKISTLPKEPIGYNFHGPLKIFDETQLMNLLSIYGGDGQCLEYVLSLLKFANPIGTWALDSCDDKLNNVTDGIHSSLGSYILKNDNLDIISNSNESLLKLLI